MDGTTSNILNPVKASWMTSKIKEDCILRNLEPETGTIVVGPKNTLIPDCNTNEFRISYNYGSKKECISSNDKAPASSLEEQVIALMLSKHGNSHSDFELSFTKGVDQLVYVCTENEFRLTINGEHGSTVCSGECQASHVHSGATLSSIKYTSTAPGYERAVNLKKGKLQYILRDVSQYLNMTLVLGVRGDSSCRYVINPNGSRIVMCNEGYFIKRVPLNNLVLPDNLFIYGVSGKLIYGGMFTYKE